jgi:hypothetical protein
MLAIENLRYRDDYRIFVNNPQDGESIVKHLTETLINLGLKLNPHKTSHSDEIISNSVKPDKLYWLSNKNKDRNFQKIPNTGYLQLWMQRITFNINNEEKYEETLCKVVNNEEVNIWNSDWLSPNFQKIIQKTSIIDRKKLASMKKEITPKEVELFNKKNWYY